MHLAARMHGGRLTAQIIAVKWPVAHLPLWQYELGQSLLAVHVFPSLHPGYPDAPDALQQAVNQTLELLNSAQLRVAESSSTSDVFATSPAFTALP